MDLLKRFAEKPEFLVGIDLDGTLLKDDKSVSPANRQAILAAQEAGIAVSLITGRSHCGFIQYLEDLKILAPCAGDAGAVMIDPVTREILQEITLSGRQMRNVLDQALGADLTCFLHYKNIILYDRPNSSIDTYAAVTPDCSYLQVADLVRDYDQQAFKVAFLAEEAVLCPLVARIHCVEPDLAVTWNHGETIEVTAKGVNKGAALLHIASMLGVPAENTIGIGDSMNDHEMLRQAAFGVAVANAADEIKELADRIAPSNEDDGVAWVLEQLVQHGTL